MHVFSIGVIEAAFTEFTVEANHLSVIITDLEKYRDVSQMHNTATAALRTNECV